MATYYVDSAAAGANNGSSWTDAWTSINSAIAVVAAGDIVLVDDGHSESVGAAVTWNDTFPHENPCRFYSVDKTAGDSLSPGASLSTTGRWRIQGGYYWHGFTFASGERLYLESTAAGQLHTFEQCTLSAADNIYIGYSDAITRSTVRWIQTNVTLDNAEFLRVFGPFEWYGGTLSSTSTATALFGLYFVNSYARLYGVDLSAFDQNPIFDIDVNAQCYSESFCFGCKLKSGATVTNTIPTHPGWKLALRHCSYGTSADPSYEFKEQDACGLVESDSARYYNTANGASDGVRTNPYSWSITSNTEVIELFDGLVSPPIMGWIAGDGTSKTVTIHLAAGAILQDDEIWLELFHPNSIDTSSLMERTTTRIDPQTTPANITQTGASDWAGTDVGEEQSLSVSIAPDKPGPLIGFIHIGKPSERVSINPNFVIS